MSYKEIYNNSKLPDLDERFALEECSTVKECAEELDRIHYFVMSKHEATDFMYHYISDTAHSLISLKDIIVTGFKNDLTLLSELFSKLF